MHRRRSRLVAGVCALAGVALGGCGGPAHVAGAGAISVGPSAADAMVSRFPGTERVLKGLDHGAETGGWAPGDKVLLGVSFERGSSHAERMLLIELLDEPGRRARYRRSVGVFGDEVRIDSPTRATRLRVYDDSGELLSDRQGQLAEVFLEHGPWEVARIGGGYAISTGTGGRTPENPRPEITLEELRPGVYGMMSLLAFGEGAGDNPTLAGLVERAFTAGQKLGLLFSMGQFEIRIGGVAAVPAGSARPGLGGLEAYDCEILISINDRLALQGRAVLAPSVAPLGVCGGIVMADLVNVADSDIRISVVLLAAERGGSGPNSNTTAANPAG